MSNNLEDANKNIITEHHNKNPKKIKDTLAVEHKIKISIRTIKRYLAIIKNENQKQVKRKAKITEPKTEIAKDKSFCIDPAGVKHKIQPNSIFEIQWGNQGPIFFDTEDKIWRYSHDNKPFDSQKKIKPWRKIRSKLFFEYDDLND